MELKVSKRETTQKGANKRMRRDGQIPAVIYSKGEVGQTLTVDQASYEEALRHIEKGFLPTTRFQLKDESGKLTPAVVKAVQYHVTTYAVEHIDFEEIHEDVELKINVPIVCTGLANCVGIKEGGVLRQVIRHMRVRCLPKHIPENFTLDVRSLHLKDSKRLADIELPEGVKPLANMQEVAAAIVKR